MNLDKLDDLARDACKNSYSPYSNFPVGAALIAADGTVIQGANIEAASYGLTICAERAAIFSGLSQGHKGKIQAISVCCAKGDPNNPNSLMPCGACLQVISEHLAKDGTISVVGGGRFTIVDLMPRYFHLPE